MGTAVTYVKKSSGELVGQEYRFFWGGGSGVDEYYDESTLGRYIAGGSIYCGQSCSCSGEGYCEVDALNERSGSGIEPSDWYGYDTCEYIGGCTLGTGVVYGKVTASCSTIYGCYIDVEWHAYCHAG